MKRLSIIFFSVFSLSICHAADIQLIPQSFSNLPGWQNIDVSTSLKAFQKSCQEMIDANAEPNYTTESIPVEQKDWLKVCGPAMHLHTSDSAIAKKFFEQYFQPHQVASSEGNKGLFTGYYLPQIPGSLTKTSIYSVPIYARPKDLVTVKLGLFNSAWQGKRIAGRMVDGRAYPYNITRQQINEGMIDKNTAVIAWVKNRADRFFLQVQGSGMVVLPNGKKLLVGYDGDNGQSYYPIGRWFLKQRIFTRDNISMQKIHDWLIAHPNQENKIMNMDPSFVFMKILPDSSPLGTQKVPLTDGYSLAVDNRLIPLGAPIWLVTTVPDPTNPDNNISFTRLLVAQDTGGAITGAVRGDIYFGSGKAAAVQAGNMQNTGQYWILLPRSFTPK